MHPKQRGHGGMASLFCLLCVAGRFGPLCYHSLGGLHELTHSLQRNTRHSTEEESHYIRWHGDNQPASAGDARDTGSIPGSGRRSPWRRKLQLKPVFLPGKSHGQRNVVDYSPLSHKRIGHDWGTSTAHIILTHFFFPSSRILGSLFFFFLFSLLFHRKWKSLSRVQLFATPWTVVHGILHTRMLEWVAFPFSRGSSQTRDRTQVSHIAGRFFFYQLSHRWGPREDFFLIGP